MSKLNLLIELVITLLAIYPMTACAVSPQDSLELRVESVSQRDVISVSDLRKFLPDSLLMYQIGGKRQMYTHASVSVYPVVDSAGWTIDTASTNPDYVLLLYNEPRAMLKVLKHLPSSYEEMWHSGMLEGWGRCYLSDVDNDGQNEIVVSLQAGVHGYGNLFLLSWDGKGIQVLNPSGRVQGFSEFNGWPDLFQTDSTWGVTVSRPQEGVKRTYEAPIGSKELKLVKEEQRPKRPH